MTNEIIGKYGIDFQNRIDDGEVDKFPGSNGPMDITGLLYEWKSVEDINSGLLADIEEALANPHSEVESGSTPVLITIHKDIVYFYPTWSEGVSSMPTADLKEIIVGWRDFLLTPPLNGASIYSPVNIGYWALEKIKKAR